MADELISLNITKKDIDRVNRILEHVKEPFPIRAKNGKDGPHLKVTDEFLEGMKARKKRWKSRNVYINIKYKDISEEQGETDPYPDQVILKEGTYEIGRLRKEWEQSIIYQRQEKKPITFQNKKRIHYYILKEPGEADKVSSVFMEDSSGSQLQYFGRDEECTDGEGKKRRNTDLSMTFWGWLIVVLLIGGYLKWRPLFSWIVVLLFLVLQKYVLFLAFALLGTPWLIVKSTAWRKRRMKSRKVTKRILETSPEFCLEKFVGILNSKLLRLLYADSAEEIGDIVSCDIAGFLQDHADVINCEFINFAFTGLREEDGYMYLYVTYTVLLERDLEEEIERRKETIKLKLARPIQSQSIMAADLYHDWCIVKIEARKK